MLRPYGAKAILAVSIFLGRVLDMRIPSRPFDRMAVHLAGSISAGSSMMQKRCDGGCAGSAVRAGKFSREAWAHITARDAASMRGGPRNGPSDRTTAGTSV